MNTNTFTADTIPSFGSVITVCYQHGSKITGLVVNTDDSDCWVIKSVTKDKRNFRKHHKAITTHGIVSWGFAIEGHDYHTNAGL
jgi:hypothetical protein